MFHQEYSSRKEISEDPPMSRLFVICGRQITKEQLTKHFQDDGEIEECVVVMDKKTGQGKGVAYVKFTKTSSAAKGLRKNGSYIENETRPIKVMISASYEKTKGGDSGTREDVNEFKYRRLFAVLPSEKDEEDIKEEFGRFGTVTQVRLVPDKKNKRQCAAYITFNSFLETALAIEGCNPNYGAKFCMPRDTFTKERETAEASNGSVRKRTHSPEGRQVDTKLLVICSNQLNQDRLWRVFDIAPGMKYCNIVTQNDLNLTASVVYGSKSEAQRAVDKIHGLEYPFGERMIVRFEEELRDESSTNEALSALGPPKPLLNAQTPCAKKAFFICMPEAVSVKLLQDAFCRFGDLINIYLIPGKRHGYAAYASEVSAERAIQQLHGMQLGDCRLKVIECLEQSEVKKRKEF